MKSQSLAERLYELFVARDDVYGVETSEGWRTERGKLALENAHKIIKEFGVRSTEEGSASQTPFSEMMKP
jgi:hypothetical protein